MARPMGAITVAAVGRLRARAWELAQQEYLGRLRHYTRLKLVEVKDAVGGAPDGVAMQQEGEALLKAVAGAQRVILLAPEGVEMGSPELARFLQKEIEVYGRIAFLIGGPLGVSEAVLDAAHVRLSLSRLTFTHEMARVILLEQLYRAFTILHGERYHK